MRDTCLVHNTVLIIILMISDKDYKLRNGTRNAVIHVPTLNRPGPITIIIGTSNTVPTQHVDTVLLKCIVIVIISLPNLSLLPVADQHVCKAIKSINPSKSAGHDRIAGCIDMFVLLLKCILNLSLPQ
jgi:hypothetical protein